MTEAELKQPNASTSHAVKRSDLPLHCPTPDSSLWNSHPRVYVPLEDSADGKWQRVRLPWSGQEGWVKAGNIKRTSY